MHVRRTSSRRKRFCGSSKDSATDTAVGAAKDLRAKAGETAQQLSDKAQATVVPAAQQAAKAAGERYRSDVQPTVEQVARTAGERFRTDVQPAVEQAARTVSAAVAAAAGAVSEESRTRGKEAEQRTRKTRKQARKRDRDAAGRSRAAVGREQPKRPWFRRVVVALGLAGAVAWVANKARAGSAPEPIRIATTPSPQTPADAEQPTV